MSIYGFAGPLIEWLNSAASEPLAIASIHATILSIVIALLSIYVFNFSTRQERIEDEVLTLCSDLNDLTRMYLYVPSIPERDISPRDRIARIQELLSGNPLLPDDEEKRGGEILTEVSLLALRWPFPPAAERTPKGGSKGRGIKFSSLEEAREWADEAIHIAQALSSTWRLNQERIHELIAPEDEQHLRATKEIGTLMTPPRVTPAIQRDVQRRALRFQEAKPSAYLSSAVQHIQTVGDVARKVRSLLRRYDLYRRRQPVRQTVVLGFAFSWVIFCTGVILPLLGPSYQTHLTLVVLPLSFYASLGLYFGTRIAKMQKL